MSHSFIRADNDFCSVPEVREQLTHAKKRILKFYRNRNIIVAIAIAFIIVWTGFGVYTTQAIEWSTDNPEIEQLELCQEESNPFDFLNSTSFQVIQEWIESIVDAFTNANLTDGFNMTDAIELILGNDTLMDPIWDALGNETSFDNIIEGIQNGTIAMTLAQTWMTSFFAEMIREVIPESWYEPFRLTGTNNGYVALRNLLVTANMEWNGDLISLIDNAFPRVGIHKSFTIRLNIGNMLITIVDHTADFIAGKIVESIISNSTSFEDVVGEAFKELFFNSDLALNVAVSGQSSWMGIRVDGHVAIKDFQNEEESA